MQVTVLIKHNRILYRFTTKTDFTILTQGRCSLTSDIAFERNIQKTNRWVIKNVLLTPRPAGLHYPQKSLNHHNYWGFPTVHG